MRWVLRSKIHKATVTEANLNYIGSITIDEDLIERVGFWPGEKVMVVDNNNGARLETYVIAGERNSGIICMNGASAHLIKQGHEIIIMGFELTDKPLKAKNILVDKSNKFARRLKIPIAHIHRFSVEKAIGIFGELGNSFGISGFPETQAFPRMLKNTPRTLVRGCF